MKERTFAANQLDTIKSDFGRVVEVVDDDNIVASFEKGQRRERTDVACATVPITTLADPLDKSMLGLARMEQRSRRQQRQQAIVVAPM